MSEAQGEGEDNSCQRASDDGVLVEPPANSEQGMADVLVASLRGVAAVLVPSPSSDSEEGPRPGEVRVLVPLDSSSDTDPGPGDTVNGQVPAGDFGVQLPVFFGLLGFPGIEWLDLGVL